MKNYWNLKIVTWNWIMIHSYDFVLKKPEISALWEVNGFFGESIGPQMRVIGEGVTFETGDHGRIHELGARHGNSCVVA